IRPPRSSPDRPRTASPPPRPTPCPAPPPARTRAAPGANERRPAANRAADPGAAEAEGDSLRGASDVSGNDCTTTRVRIDAGDARPAMVDEPDALRGD